MATIDPGWKTLLYTPFFSEASLGPHKVKTLTASDPLCRNVIEFLKNTQKVAVLGEKRDYAHHEASGLVNEWRTRVEMGNPFSGYAILRGEEVVGVIQMDVGRDGKLHVDGMGLETDRDQRALLNALDWLIRDHLPHLEKLSRRDWPELEKTSIVIQTRFDNAIFKRLRMEMHFSSETCPGPLSFWKKPRSVYEAAGILYDICVAVLKEIRAGNYFPLRGRPLRVHEVSLNHFVSRRLA